MIKKAISVFLIFCWTYVSVSAPDTAYARVPLLITASSAVLFDHGTNRLVYSKTPHDRRAPASTTKLLTAMVAMDKLSLDRVIRIPSFVTSIEPSKVHLRPGETYSVRDLIRATLISSANDAAEVLAVVAAGSRSKFAAQMNRKAKAIGAGRSHFVNASGLPAKGQTSTAYDMALIMKHAEKYPFLVNTLKENKRIIYSRGGHRITLVNHNKMLWREPSREVIGKTGWTRAARHCFVGRFRVMQRKVVIAVLGSRSLWRDVRKLLDYQFGHSINRIRQNRKFWSTRETKKIQKGLKRAGFYKGAVDGIFGPQTLRAVERFQEAQHLQADGVVGSLTWKRLQRYL